MPKRVILPASIRRKHRVSKRDALATMHNSGMPEPMTDGRMLYIGRDTGGRLTRVVVIQADEDDNTLVIIHAQPLEWDR